MTRIYYLLLITCIGIELSGQCYPDRHNTSIEDSWISCTRKVSPNANRASSHWILYEFTTAQTIESIRLWNSNLPEFSDIAVRQIAIDYSVDGTTWAEAGSFSLSQPAGNSFYEGEQLALVEPISSRYVLLTALDSYGSTCAGIAEVKFNLADATTSIAEESDRWSIDIFPNPSTDFANIVIDSDEFSLQSVQIINLKGQVIRNIIEQNNSFRLDLTGIADGAYFVKFVGKETLATRKIWIINP